MNRFTRRSAVAYRVVALSALATVLLACAREVDPIADDGGVASDAGIANAADGRADVVPSRDVTDAGSDTGGHVPDSGACSSGTTMCGSACVATATDVNHCGACGQACPGATDANARAICTAGVCGVACNAGFVGDGHQCQNVVGTLSGLRWELPCVGPHNDRDGCDGPPAPVTTQAVCGGTPSVTYDVVLRFRGVVEERTYIGGRADGLFYIGGATPDRSDPFNVYSLAISSPAQQYYLNAGESGMRECVAADYLETVQVTAGATVTLTADDVEGTLIANVDASGNPIVVPGIAPSPAPYDGQFLQMDIVSVTPH